MSNLHCPECGHLIGDLKLAATQPETPDGRVAAWLRGAVWPNKVMLTADMLERYRRQTGDDQISHRAFSIAMQRAGVVKRVGSRGVRVFERPH